MALNSFQKLHQHYQQGQSQKYRKRRYAYDNAICYYTPGYQTFYLLSFLPNLSGAVISGSYEKVRGDHPALEDPALKSSGVGDSCRNMIKPACTCEFFMVNRFYGLEISYAEELAFAEVHEKDVPQYFFDPKLFRSVLEMMVGGEDSGGVQKLRGMFGSESA